jgi:hypothetical protein
MISPLVGLVLLSLVLRSWAEPVSTTAHELLRTPTQFDGKRVLVRGYYVGTFGESRLFGNLKDVTHCQYQVNSIWVDQSIWANPAEVRIGISDVDSLTKHTVRLIGTFRYRPTNQTGLSPCALINVTYFRPSR